MTVQAVYITIRKDGRYMGRFQIGHRENEKKIYQSIIMQKAVTPISFDITAF